MNKRSTVVGLFSRHGAHDGRTFISSEIRSVGMGIDTFGNTNVLPGGVWHANAMLHFSNNP